MAPPPSAASQTRRVHSSHPCPGQGQRDGSSWSSPGRPWQDPAEESLWAAAAPSEHCSPEPSTCVMQTRDTISQRSLLSCAPGPAGSPGSSPPSGPCISAAVCAGAASLRGTLPAAASCSRKPGPSPAAVASSPPGRSLWPSGGKSSEC